MGFCLTYSTFHICLETNISQTLQSNNSGIPAIKNAKFSGYYFIGTRAVGDTIKSALVYL